MTADLQCSRHFDSDDVRVDAGQRRLSWAFSGCRQPKGSLAAEVGLVEELCRLAGVLWALRHDRDLSRLPLDDLFRERRPRLCKIASLDQQRLRKSLAERQR